MQPWMAPDVIRTDEPFVGTERAQLDGFLEWQRATLLVKCARLTAGQLALRSMPPSNLSLLGLIRHVANVERTWFRRRFGAERIEPLYSGENADFDEIDPATAEHDYAQLLREQELARSAVRNAPLDATFVHARRGVMSLRWVYIHMLDEYSRHCGHADMLRERIDGRTGI